MIRTIVLDVGNVLEAFSPQTLLEKLIPDPVLRAELDGKIFSTPIWLMLDRGILDAEAAAELLCQDHPHWREPVRHILEHWPDHMEPYPGSVNLLNRLRQEGYRLILLSNYHGPFFDRVPWHSTLKTLIHGSMLSSEVQLLKPDPEIFHQLCRTFDLVPQETLFLDDSAANIEVALWLGFRCYHVVDPELLPSLRTNDLDK